MYTLYSLTSGLHSETVAEPADERFIQDIEKALGEAFEFGRTDFSEYSGHGTTSSTSGPEGRREYSKASSARKGL